MATLTLLLADTSAWHRSTHPEVAERWRERLDADRVAICPQVRLEILYSARSADDYAALVPRLDALHQVPNDQRTFARALDVQAALARQHALHHRSVKIPDLLIAAAAELADATVWHYDEDYDRIGAVTGQPTAWIAPRGSL